MPMNGEGRVLVIGGDDGKGPTTSIEIYNLQTRESSLSVSLAEGRCAQHWAQLPSLRWTAPPVEHSSIAERGNAVLAAHLTAGAHIPLPAGIPATISRTAAAANSAPPPARRTWHAAFHPVVANLCPVLNAFSLFRAPSRRGRGTGQLNRAAIYPMGSGVGSALGGEVTIPVDACVDAYTRTR